MLFKDKLILVFYINIDNVPRADVLQYLNEFMESVQNGADDSVVFYCIPVIRENSRMDYINGDKLTEEQTEHFNKMMGDIENIKKRFEK